MNTRTVKVTIKDDKRFEGTEAFGAQLIVPNHHKRNGLKLGAISLATVFINDGTSCSYIHMCIHAFKHFSLFNHFVVLQQMIIQLPVPQL